jgi:hypothetical protein
MIIVLQFLTGGGECCIERTTAIQHGIHSLRGGSPNPCPLP